MNMPIATDDTPFITTLLGGLQLEVADTVELTKWQLHEDKVTIPAECFQSK